MLYIWVSSMMMMWYTLNILYSNQVERETPVISYAYSSSLPIKNKREMRKTNEFLYKTNLKRSFLSAPLLRSPHFFFFPTLSSQHHHGSSRFFMSIINWFSLLIFYHDPSSDESKNLKSIMWNTESWITFSKHSTHTTNARTFYSHGGTLHNNNNQSLTNIYCINISTSFLYFLVHLINYCLFITVIIIVRWWWKRWCYHHQELFLFFIFFISLFTFNTARNHRRVFFPTAVITNPHHHQHHSSNHQLHRWTDLMSRFMKWTFYPFIRNEKLGYVMWTMGTWTFKHLFIDFTGWYKNAFSSLLHLYDSFPCWWKISCFFHQLRKNLLSSSIHHLIDKYR